MTEDNPTPSDRPAQPASNALESRLPEDSRHTQDVSSHTADSENEAPSFKFVFASDLYPSQSPSPASQDGKQDTKTLFNTKDVPSSMLRAFHADPTLTFRSDFAEGDRYLPASKQKPVREDMLPGKPYLQDSSFMMMQMKKRSRLSQPALVLSKRVNTSITGLQGSTKSSPFSFSSASLELQDIESRTLDAEFEFKPVLSIPRLRLVRVGPSASAGDECGSRPLLSSRCKLPVTSSSPETMVPDYGPLADTSAPCSVHDGSLLLDNTTVNVSSSEVAAKHYPEQPAMENTSELDAYTQVLEQTFVKRSHKPQTRHSNSQGPSSPSDVSNNSTDHTVHPLVTQHVRLPAMPHLAGPHLLPPGGVLHVQSFPPWGFQPFPGSPPMLVPMPSQYPSTAAVTGSGSQPLHVHPAHLVKAVPYLIPMPATMTPMHPIQPPHFPPYPTQPMMYPWSWPGALTSTAPDSDTDVWSMAIAAAKQQQAKKKQRRKRKREGNNGDVETDTSMTGAADDASGDDFVCVFCFRTFSQRNSLALHIKSHRDAAYRALGEFRYQLYARFCPSLVSTKRTH